MNETFNQLISDHPILGPIIFIIVRALAIVISPIPGVAIDAPGMIVFGWKRAFIYAEIGIMLGAMTAFYLARWFREPLVRRFVSLRRIQEWEERLSRQESFWTWVAIRLPTNPAFDYISYAAGLTKCSPVIFFFSTLLGNIPSMLLIYVVGGTALQQNVLLGLSAIVGIMILSVMYLRHRRRKV